MDRKSLIMTKKQKIQNILPALKKRYENPECELVYICPHELLIATRLSAQCTDIRVNIVTKPLFERYKSIDDFANASIYDIQDIIKTCGLYKTKAKDIINMSKMLIQEFGSVVPDNIDDLIKLPGIGRKTANLVMGDIYKKPSIVVDTHCIRVSNRLGLVKEKDPYKIELVLKKLIPKEESTNFCHRIVFFGRDVCKARNPNCCECELFEFCTSKGKF